MAYGVEAVSPRDGFVVTKSDTVSFSVPVAGLYVGGAGDVTVLTQLGTTLLFSAVPAGTILPIRCSKVFSTGTTATLITALVY
jgi:hypothetical protein